MAISLGIYYYPIFRQTHMERRSGEVRSQPAFVLMLSMYINVIHCSPVWKRSEVGWSFQQREDPKFLWFPAPESSIWGVFSPPCGAMQCLNRVETSKPFEDHTESPKKELSEKMIKKCSFGNMPGTFDYLRFQDVSDFPKKWEFVAAMVPASWQNLGFSAVSADQNP